jgi:hypothetical protein
MDSGLADLLGIEAQPVLDAAGQPIDLVEVAAEARVVEVDRADRVAVDVVAVLVAGVAAGAKLLLDQEGDGRIDVVFRLDPQGSLLRSSR